MKQIIYSEERIQAIANEPGSSQVWKDLQAEYDHLLHFMSAVKQQRMDRLKSESALKHERDLKALPAFSEVFLSRNYINTPLKYGQMLIKISDGIKFMRVQGLNEKWKIPYKDLTATKPDHAEAGQVNGENQEDKK